ncbi:MAG: RIP metalloprotease RseP [Verrucomicrobia bacterium]|jgi:regulator of sigma E protease|nr:RIP metalloprotease RseP [Verrucomicrobiota bacterium]
MSVLKIIFIILEVVLLFNLLIFVHELGHFLAARWRGLRIDRFAIWFGKPIWSTRINGVEYALGWIPAGGYVALPQMATMEAIEGKTESSDEPLPPVSATDKIIVAFAGPLFSFLLALVFAVVVMTVGRPVSESEVTTVIGYVVEGGPADQAGLKAGDRILEVDHKPVKKFGGMTDSITWAVVRSEGETVQVKVERDGETLEFFPRPTREETRFWQRKGLRQIQLAPAMSAKVAELYENGPAERAGIQTGDLITAIHGKPIHHYVAVADHIEAHPEEPVVLTIERTGRPFEVTVKPERPVEPADSTPKIGIVWDGRGQVALIYPGAIEQVRDSVRAMIETFGALLDRGSEISAQHLGGAVKIMEVYYRLFDSEEGWRLAIWFSVLLNVNLAVLNLLPIPVLDGGHILLAILEGIRRKPISHRTGNIIQTACAVVLIGFMLYIAVFDVQELPWKRAKEDAPPEIRFAPPSAEAH